MRQRNQRGFCVFKATIFGLLLSIKTVAAGNLFSSDSAVKSAAVFVDMWVQFETCQSGKDCAACVAYYKELSGKDIPGTEVHSSAASSESCSVCSPAVSATASMILRRAAEECVKLSAGAATELASVTAGCSVVMEDMPAAERPFVQGAWQLEWRLENNRDIKKLFQQLFYTGCNDQDLLLERWQRLVTNGKVFQMTDRLVMFLYRFYDARRGERGIFEVLAADPALRWLSEQINQIVLNGSLPFEQRRVLSADCAEAYAEDYAHRNGLSDDGAEALKRIIKMFLVPLESIPR